MPLGGLEETRRAAAALRIKRTTLVEKIKTFDRERARSISRSA